MSRFFRTLLLPEIFDLRSQRENQLQPLSFSRLSPRNKYTFFRMDCLDKSVLARQIVLLLYRRLLLSNHFPEKLLHPVRKPFAIIPHPKKEL